MDMEKYGKVFRLTKEVAASLRGSRPLARQNIPQRSKIKILSSSSWDFYEFTVADCVLKSIKREQVYVIARDELDSWVTEAEI